MNATPEQLDSIRLDDWQADQAMEQVENREPDYDSMAAEEEIERLEREANGRPMRPGDTLAVGSLLVEKLTDTKWAVRTPADEWTGVDEDPEADCGYCGYVGEQWAIDAVLQAEQMFDMGDAVNANAFTTDAF